jgi:hypothetical protein
VALADAPDAPEGPVVVVVAIIGLLPSVVVVGIDTSVIVEVELAVGPGKTSH